MDDVVASLLFSCVELASASLSAFLIIKKNLKDYEKKWFYLVQLEVPKWFPLFQRHCSQNIDIFPHQSFERSLSVNCRHQRFSSDYLLDRESHPVQSTRRPVKNNVVKWKIDRVDGNLPADSLPFSILLLALDCLLVVHTRGALSHLPRLSYLSVVHESHRESLKIY